jgi:hypothetical protein
MKAIRTAVLILLGAMVGCDEPADDGSAQSQSRAAKPRRPARPGAKRPVKTKTPAGRREEAKAGVGKKGRDYKFMTSVSAYFSVKQKLAYSTVEYAVKLYKAEHGRFPKSWDEFKKEILDANMFKLPELPEGDKYVYDAEKGQLMVEHPPK